MPSGNDWFRDAFGETHLMAILRGFGVERSVELAGRAWDAGLALVEVPLQTPEDEDALAAVVALAHGTGRAVGAGTVTTLEHVALAKRLGAAFTVSPGFSPDIVEASHAAGMPSLPGVATGSEVQAARAMGLTWMKAFPATTLGPSWITAMHGPFPEVSFVATGGVDASNARAFLDAGCAAAAVGSALADPAQLDLLRGIVRGAR